MVRQTFQARPNTTSFALEEIGAKTSTNSITPIRKLDVTDFDTMMQYEGRLFVEATYVTLLKRLPDLDGLAFYLARLHDGIGKLQILHEIASSQECRDAGVNLPGLQEAFSQAEITLVANVG